MPHKSMAWVIARTVGLAGAALASSAGAQGTPGSVAAFSKISATDGGFPGLLLHQEERFGGAPTSLGDLNGDGFEDIVVTAFADADGGVGSGAVWVLFLDKDQGVTESSKISATTGAAGGGGLPIADNANFGQSTARLDSVGGTQLLVGANGDPTAGPNVGAVWCLTLDATGSVTSWPRITPADPDLSLANLATISGFGASVASIGDLNGDDHPDIAVGAPWGDSGRGSVWTVLLDGSGGILGHQRIGSNGGAEPDGGFPFELAGNEWFGKSIAALGDLDGDGVEDVAVGAYGPNGLGEAGRIYILFLNADGSVKSAQKITSGSGGFEGEIFFGDGFGASAVSPGDIDGDDVRDLIVGEPGSEDGGGDTGAIWCLFLNSDGTVKSHAKISATDGCFSGDLDQYDGFGSGAGMIESSPTDSPRIAVSALYDDDGGHDIGAAWIIELNTLADATPGTWQDLGNALSGSCGTPVATGQGDLLGDSPGVVTLTACPDSSAHLVLGFIPLLAPFKGGTLVPLPTVLVYGLPVDHTGTLSIEFDWPCYVPSGLPTYIQFWLPDPGGPVGFSASNALSALAP